MSQRCEAEAERGGELAVVMITLSDARARQFADRIADQLRDDERFEIVGVGKRRGWNGGAADVVARIFEPADLAALEAVVDSSVADAWRTSGIPVDAAVLIEVVRSEEFDGALAGAHEAVREALRGNGVY